MARKPGWIHFQSLHMFFPHWYEKRIANHANWLFLPPAVPHVSFSGCRPPICVSHVDPVSAPLSCGSGFGSFFLVLQRCLGVHNGSLVILLGVELVRAVQLCRMLQTRTQIEGESLVPCVWPFAKKKNVWPAFFCVSGAIPRELPGLEDSWDQIPGRLGHSWGVETALAAFWRLSATFIMRSLSFLSDGAQRMGAAISDGMSKPQVYWR